MDIKQESSVFKTSDIALATCLIMYNFNLIEINVDQKTRGVFIFENSNELQIIQNSFYNESLKVSPQEYYITLKRVKGRLYNAIQEID